MNPFPGADPANSWVVDDDDDEEELTEIDAKVYAISQSLRELRQAPTHPVIELDDDEDAIVEGEARIENEIFDLTRDDDPSSPLTRRNPDIASVGHRLLKVTWNGLTLTEGAVVQINTLSKQPLRYKYLKIKAIYRPAGSHRARDTLIRGTPYVKSMHLGGLLKWRPREVAAVYDVDRDDPRAVEVQAQIEVQITEVTGSTRALVTTNAPYPEHSEVGVLVCRWKYFRHWPTGKRREAACTSIHPDYEAAMVCITPEEADAPFRVSRETLRRDWRGETVEGGAYRLFEGGSPTAPIDIDEPVLMPSTRRPSRPSARLAGQKYTFFDAFSGAGGASRGAVKAGLKPRFAVDHWEPACRSLPPQLPHLAPVRDERRGFYYLQGRHHGRRPAPLAALPGLLTRAHDSQRRQGRGEPRGALWVRDRAAEGQAAHLYSGADVWADDGAVHTVLQPPRQHVHDARVLGPVARRPPRELGASRPEEAPHHDRRGAGGVPPSVPPGVAL